MVGAVAGPGRVLCQHLFSHMPWERVVLIDQPQARAVLEATDWPFAVTPDLAVIDGGVVVPLRGSADVARPGTAVCLAVPHHTLGDVARALAALLGDDAVVFDTASLKTSSSAVLGPILGTRFAFGIRPLFDALARSLDGQTVVLTHRGDPTPAQEWFARAVEALGGVVKATTPQAHDRSMEQVQTLTQQALIAFADAAMHSELDLEADLWEMRTPSFETLLGLAVRTMSEAQQPSVAVRQADPAAVQANLGLRGALTRLEQAVRTGDSDAIGDHIAGLRDELSGSLFETIHQTGAAVVSATQAKRAELSRHRREHTHVGIVTADKPDDLRVGRIVSLSPTDVTLDETLVGSRGHAVLLEGEGLRNARALGVGGKVRRTRFGMGRIDVLAGPELDARLDRWLAHIRRDVRFLVPESVSGAGVLHVLRGVPRVRAPRVVSEVVRTGQRAVVVRLEIRGDADVDAAVEDLRQRVSDAYAWPLGMSLPRRDAAPGPVAYLGPAGTFSETAARHCAATLGLLDPPLIPMGSFEDVLEAAHAGHMGVLPICSSASGLVERAAEALLVHGEGLAAGGVADVAVRFDAYVPEGVHLEDLRGAQVLSHPQALRQCTRFIARWRLRPVETMSTAEAGRRVAGGGAPAVVLAGAGLGDSLGLHVAEREVDDLSGSLTRFLVIARQGEFGRLSGGSDPTLRFLWLARSTHALGNVLAGPGPSFDEIITGPSGLVLLVTSRASDPEPVAGRVGLGRLPWTPRTPLVRLEA